MHSDSIEASPEAELNIDMIRNASLHSAAGPMGSPAPAAVRRNLDRASVRLAVQVNVPGDLKPRRHDVAVYRAENHD
jgi:hypothetical protein